MMRQRFFSPVRIVYARLECQTGFISQMDSNLTIKAALEYIPQQTRKSGACLRIIRL